MEEQNLPTGFIRQGTVFVPAQAMSLADISVIPASMATASYVSEQVVSEAQGSSHSGKGAIPEVIINYQRTYWEIGMGLYQKTHRETFRPDVMDAAITNLYIGLIKLFGMHWTPEDKQRYSEKRNQIYRDRFPTAPVNQDEQEKFDSEYPKTEKDYTFPLYTMIKAGFPLAKGWDLTEVDDGALMMNFKRLNSYFTDLSRHFEEKKVPAAVTLALSDLDQYVDTVRKIVRWFMIKFYGSVPEHARSQYCEVFGIPF